LAKLLMGEQRKLNSELSVKYEQLKKGSDIRLWAFKKC
jgi:hypothetical protein